MTEQLNDQVADEAMACPHCGNAMIDVTESWHTFSEAAGAEYLANYVTIWHCPNCSTVAGAENGEVQWIMDAEPVGNDE